MYTHAGTERPHAPQVLDREFDNSDSDDEISAMLERGTLNRDFALSMQTLGFGDEPMSYKEALLRPDYDLWKKAEDVEWNAINEYKTFKRITLAEMRKINPFARIVLTKWCYKRKVDRYKARVVAKGFMQSPWDVGETHAGRSQRERAVVCASKLWSVAAFVHVS